MGKLWTPDQDKEEAAEKAYTPDEVKQAVALAIQMGPLGRLHSSGMQIPPGELHAATDALTTLCMVIRKYVDSREQFELLMATAHRSGDMSESIKNMAARAEAGTLIKPNSSEWSHRKEALAKGNLSELPSRAERRRWARLQRKRAKQAEKIGKKIK